jgi:hypothetical protein
MSESSLRACISSVTRALARALSWLDGNDSSGSTFDMTRIDERIAQLKTEITRSPERTTPEPRVQTFGKRRTYRK